LAEIGYTDLNFSNWSGVVVSSKVPAELTEKIHAALQKVAANPAVRKRLIDSNFEPVADQPLAKAASALREEYDRNAAIVKAFNIKLN
jgi:tripartite-type tricarboxylate transporter receptor subunit TctC